MNISFFRIMVLEHISYLSHNGNKYKSEIIFLKVHVETKSYFYFHTKYLFAINVLTVKTESMDSQANSQELTFKILCLVTNGYFETSEVYG
jgi:hypothetical protein